MRLRGISLYDRNFIFIIAVLLACTVFNSYIFTQYSKYPRTWKNIFSSEPEGQLEISPDGNFRDGSIGEKRPFLPADEPTLNALKKYQLLKIYWRYINTLQVLCRNQRRLGSLKDGGKEICVDDLYKPRQPCLVYSFGSNFQFDFEVDVIRNYKCEVHTFDPSKPIRNITLPRGTHFHLIGLWNETMQDKDGWRMETLSSVRKQLNHTNRIIDVLKMDIEGGEWIVLPQIFQSGVLQYVKQICLEVHVGNLRKKQRVGNISIARQLTVLRKLYDQGFQIFMREHNLFSLSKFKPPYQSITMVNEISLINKNYINSK